MAVKKTPHNIVPLPQLKPTNSPRNRPKSVAELKKKYRYLPLHFLFGIEPEIEYQCPTLDVYLGQLKNAKEGMEKIRRCKSLEIAKIHAATSLHELDTLPKEIDEQTRTSFENLRRMAEGWKQLAIKAINDTKNPEKYLKV